MLAPEVFQATVRWVCRVAERSTCARRKIGCVLVSAKGDIIAEGYNGIGREHSCLDPSEALCPDADVKAGEGAYRPVRCWGAHAEQRAVANARGAHAYYAFVSKAPCPSCCVLLWEQGVRTIVYQTMSNDTDNRELWAQHFGGEWLTYDEAWNIARTECLKSRPN